MGEKGAMAHDGEGSGTQVEQSGVVRNVPSINGPKVAKAEFSAK